MDKWINFNFGFLCGVLFIVGLVRALEFLKGCVVQRGKPPTINRIIRHQFGNDVVEVKILQPNFDDPYLKEEWKLKCGAQVLRNKSIRRANKTRT